MFRLLDLPADRLRLLNRIFRDAHHIPADDLADIIVRVTALDKSDCVQRPVCPCETVRHLSGFSKIIFRPKRSKWFALPTSFWQLPSFLTRVLRRVCDIGTDRHMVHSKVLRDVFNMVKQRGDVPRAAQEF